MHDDAQDLAEKIQRGNTDALAQFLQQFRPQLIAYIARRSGPALQKKIEPDDIFQEVSIDAVRRIAETKQLDRDVFGWLCQLAEFRLIDAHRRFFETDKRDADREVGLNAPATESRAFIDLLVASMTTPSQAFSRNEREMALHAALAELPEESRDVLRLRYVDGLASKEIAQRVGKSDGAIRVILTRAVQRLQQALGVS